MLTPILATDDPYQAADGFDGVRQEHDTPASAGDVVRCELAKYRLSGDRRTSSAPE